MKKGLVIIVSVFFCFLTGFVASKFQVESIQEWYPALNKSALTPPNNVFPIVWSILYLLMGISAGLIIISDNRNKVGFISIFILQLFLNFTWSINFFFMRNPLLGIINIVFLDIVVLYYVLKTFRTAKISSLLFLPYLIWICFATYLNLYILLNN